MSRIDEKIIFEPTGFEYQNTKAKVVIVGITPGMPQGQVSDISLKTDNTIQEITNNINLNI